jgi:hypothetical protein
MRLPASPAASINHGKETVEKTRGEKCWRVDRLNLCHYRNGVVHRHEHKSLGIANNKLNSILYCTFLELLNFSTKFDMGNYQKMIKKKTGM